MVCDAHLFFYNFMQATLEPAGREKWCPFSMWHGVGRLSMGPELILIDALSSACWEKEKKKRSRSSQEGAFFPGPEARHALLAVPYRIFVVVRCN
jgi:hypothetical protein